MCHKSYTPHKWVASVQLRQKANHKKTFFFIEQLILKHKMHVNCVNIKERIDGLDFYFNSRSHAAKFTEFVSDVVPTKVTQAKQLISHDERSNTFVYKYTYSVEIPPICKEDIICLPLHFQKTLGGLGPIVLCYRINSSLHFIDPITLKTGEIQGSIYWKHPFDSFMNSKQSIQYIILDKDVDYKTKNEKYVLGDVEITRADDIGDEAPIFTKTHLGAIVNPGDEILGYDLKNSNFNDLNIYSYDEKKIS